MRVRKRKYLIKVQGHDVDHRNVFRDLIMNLNRKRHGNFTSHGNYILMNL